MCDDAFFVLVDVGNGSEVERYLEDFSDEETEMLRSRFENDSRARGVILQIVCDEELRERDPKTWRKYHLDVRLKSNERGDAAGVDSSLLNKLITEIRLNRDTEDRAVTTDELLAALRLSRVGRVTARCVSTAALNCDWPFPFEACDFFDVMDLASEAALSRLGNNNSAKMVHDLIGLCWVATASISKSEVLSELATDLEGYARELCVQLGLPFRELNSQIEDIDDQSEIVWHKSLGELRRNGEVVRKVRSVKVAKNVVIILDVFQEEKWPRRVDSPFTTDEKRREAVSSLNEGLSQLVFEADGNDSIRWRIQDEPAA